MSSLAKFTYLTTLKELFGTELESHKSHRSLCLHISQDEAEEHRVHPRAHGHWYFGGQQLGLLLAVRAPLHLPARAPAAAEDARPAGQVPDTPSPLKLSERRQREREGESAKFHYTIKQLRATYPRSTAFPQCTINLSASFCAAGHSSSLEPMPFGIFAFINASWTLEG